MACIHLERVTVSLPRPSGGTPERRSRSLAGLFRRRQISVRHPVLRDISLHIADGERVALVGADGAGKSTLLRLLAGEHRPDAGRILVEGQVLCLADVTGWLDADATGWQNLERRAGPAEAPALADFTGLADFLDLPVHCYSAGMRWRLGFTLATARDADILLVDDVYGGDLAFQRRAEMRLAERIARSRIAVVVSRDLEALARQCGQGVWLEGGQVRDQGPLEDVLAAYRGAVPLAA
jgi:ABC-type polysaccharide/polyol phosphate transport system ATPase subunit